MPINDIVNALIQERDRLDRAIEVLRGGSTNGAGVSHTPRTTKPHTQLWTPAKRKAAAERMRKYWAGKRKKAVATAKNA